MIEQHFTELLESYGTKNIVIYGAGEYASVLYTYLMMQGLSDSVSCFVVSDLLHSQQKIMDKPVYSFDDRKSEIKDSLILVAMKYADTILNKLKSEEVKIIYHVGEKDIWCIKEAIAKKYADLPVKRNKIFIDCYSGDGYKCNSKYIAEGLLKLGASVPVEIVWDLKEGSKDKLPKEIRTVTRNSLEYFEELNTSGIYIGNLLNDNYPVKRKEQYIIQTWHGSGPFKMMYKQRCGAMYTNVDLFISNMEHTTEMYKNEFSCQGEILECGFPRMDILFRNDIKAQIKKKLELPDNKKIVLYAPTFREERRASFARYDLNMQMVLEALRERFGEELILLYRFHREVCAFIDGRELYPEGIDVTNYTDVMELLTVADVLITDYSSVMWDFSIQRKPVFLYHNDETEYGNERGFYTPPREWPYIKAHSSEEMCQVIRDFSEEKYIEDLEKFIEKNKSFADGHSTEKIVDRIIDVIEHPEKYGK